MTPRLSMVLLSSLLVFACARGDDDGGNAGTHPDARPGGSSPDARTGGTVDGGSFGGIDGGAPVVCAAEDDYGEMGMLMGETAGTAAEGFMSLAMTANSDPDLITVELYGDYGAFIAAGGIKNGSYPLTGADADYEDCGACVYVIDENGEIYMAASGTLELTNVTDRLAGTLTGVEFRHVTLSEETFETIDAPDGCRSRLGRVTFDQALMPM